MPSKRGAEPPHGELAAPVSTDRVRTASLLWVFPEGQLPLDLMGDGPTREWSIGRDSTCDVCIVSKQVSRRHALLTRDAGGRARITDLESRNGTRVNGRRVGTAELDPGDIIRLGSWVGVVTETPGRFEEVAPYLFGGATLRAALAPLKARERPGLAVIEGEAGTGKKTVARSLHTWTGRTGAFVAVDCNAIPRARIEAELFGDRQVASGSGDPPSLLRSAHGGTLLIDRVSALAPGVQTRLLDAVTRRTPHDPSDPPLDVCVVMTAQEPLTSSVRDGRLHREWFAHVDGAGVTIRLPPLRQRREDIAGLFLNLLRALTERALEVSPDLLEKLCLHDWPFNVRELVGLTRRMLMLYGSEPLLTEKHLPDRFSAVATDAFSSEERKT